jgi:hypothetical protein
MGATMLMFIWMSVMASFLPGGEQVASLQAAAFQAHLRATLEMEEPRPAIGAAAHIAHYRLPALAR